MNWTRIWSWLRNNFKWVIPAIGILLVCLFLFFAGNNVANANNKIPGGGFGTFLASGLMFFLAWKFKTEKNIAAKLVGAGLVLFTVWAWPRVMPAINSFGIAPGLTLALTIFVGIWMKEKGAGAFWWRRILFLFLIASMLGASGGIIKKGWDDFKSSTGISTPSISLPAGVRRYIDATADYLGYRANRKISKLKEAYIEVETSVYKRNKDGSFVVRNFDYSGSDSEKVKIFLLNQSVERDGITLELVRIGDPIIGPVFWVYSGDISFSSEAILPPQETPADEKTGALEPTPLLFGDGEWEVAGTFVVPVDRATFSALEKDGQLLKVAEVAIPYTLIPGWEYRITASGCYEKKFTTIYYKNIPVGGDNTIVGKSPPNGPFSPEIPYGALTLRVGNRFPLYPKSGNAVYCEVSEESPVFAQLNIKAIWADFWDEEGRSKLRPPTQPGTSPLTIKIERRKK